MLTQEEMDKIVRDAKKDLTTEQIKNALRKCSYGGPVPVDMGLKGGDSFEGGNKNNHV